MAPNHMNSSGLADRVWDLPTRVTGIRGTRVHLGLGKSGPRVWSLVCPCPGYSLVHARDPGSIGCSRVRGTLDSRVHPGSGYTRVPGISRSRGYGSLLSATAQHWWRRQMGEGHPEDPQIFGRFVLGFLAVSDRFGGTRLPQTTCQNQTCKCKVFVCPVLPASRKISRCGGPSL